MLKESFKIYKAISEGLINLADKFFEMDYLSAQKGIEIYKEAIVSSERLQVLLSSPVTKCSLCCFHVGMRACTGQVYLHSHACMAVLSVWGLCCRRSIGR